MKNSFGRHWRAHASFKQKYAIAACLGILMACSEMPASKKTEDVASASKEEITADTTSTVVANASSDIQSASAPSAASPASIHPATCDFTAVQSAVNSARLGTTIHIPAGDCNWNTQQLNVPAGIYLQGAGQNATTIRREGAVSNARYLIAYHCRNGRRAMFSGMTLVGNGNAAIQDKGLGLLEGCVDFTVSHSTFTNFVFSAVYVGDATNQRGVIYKNNFIDNFSASLMNLGYGVVVYGGGEWPPLALGSKNAVFVEDNYFSGNRHNIASNNGSVYVFRYNKVVGQDPAKDFAMTDAHGLSSSTRGSRSYEIYDNEYTTNISSGLQRTAIGIRGGDGVIFDNTVPPTVSRAVELMQEGFDCGTYPGPDQIRSLYIWNNKAHAKFEHGKHAIDNACPASIKLNRDYFLMRRPGYVPFPYPHPLRADADAKLFSKYPADQKLSGNAHNE